MMRKILAASLVLVLVLSFTACDQNDYPPVEEIVDNSTQAMADISTCTFDLDMSMDMDGEVEGEAMEITMEVDGSGALDGENHQMQITMTMKAAVPGEDDMDVDVEMYLVENNFYTMLYIPGMGPMWTKMDILDEMLEGTAEEYWEPTELVEFQSELLEAVEREVTGSGKVDGVDCYVLEITVDMAQLWELIMQQLDDTAMEMADVPEDFEELLGEMFRNLSMKQWIAQDTYLLAKVEMEMDMEINPEDMGYPDEGEGISLDMTMTMLVDDYNQPVSIELPPEAEEATEVPLEDFPFGGY